MIDWIYADAGCDELIGACAPKASFPTEDCFLEAVCAKWKEDEGDVELLIGAVSTKWQEIYEDPNQDVFGEIHDHQGADDWDEVWYVTIQQ